MKKATTFNIDIQKSVQENVYELRVVGYGNLPATENAVESKLPADVISNDLQYIKERVAEPAEMLDVGQALYRFLIPQKIERLFQTYKEKAAREKGGIRLLLSWDRSEVELDHLPWELLHDGQQYLCLDRTFSLIRYIKVEEPAQQLDIKDESLRVLMVTADPADMPAHLADEPQLMREALRNLVDTHRANLEIKENVTRSDLEKAIKNFQPHVLHFAGHGHHRATNEEGELQLLGPEGNAKAIGASDLAIMLKGSSVRLAVLSACQSAVAKSEAAQAENFLGVTPTLMQAGLTAAVGMQLTINYRHAQKFLTAFYEGLASRHAIDRVMSDARVGMYSEDDPHEPNFWIIPTLFMRAEDATVFPESMGREVSPLAHLSQMPIDSVPPVTNLPAMSRIMFSENKHFVGREEELQKLAEIFKNVEHPTKGTVAALTGMGGVGKTQTAVEFVHRYGRYFAGGVFWINMAEDEGVPHEIIACGQKMGIKKFEEKSDDEKIAAVYQLWQQSIPCLLIFDNCEERQLFEKWQPKTGGARILITSRRTDWSRGSEDIQTTHLETLPRTDSVTFLQNLTQQKIDETEADDLAAFLGDLPLALDLAANFLKYAWETGEQLTVDEYLLELQEESILQHESFEEMEDVDEDFFQVDNLIAVFQKSYEKLNKNELAKTLFFYAACFQGGDFFPRDVLLATLNYDRAEGKISKPVKSLERKQRRALDMLVRLSLVDLESNEMLRLHKLVAQFATLTKAKVEDLSADYDHTVAEVTKDRFGDSLSKENTSYLRLWVNQVLYLANKLRAEYQSLTATLYMMAAIQFDNDYNRENAIRYARIVLEIRRSLFDQENPKTAETITMLGGFLMNAHQYDEAQEYLEKSLEIRKTLFDHESIEVAESLGMLGMVWMNQGNFEEALHFTEEALKIIQRVLGNNHQKTLESLSLKAMIIGISKSPEESLPIQKECLSLYKEFHEDKQLKIAQLSKNIGVNLLLSGDYEFEEVEEYLDASLDIYQKSLGRDHPRTMAVYSQKGALLMFKGRYFDALPYLEQALPILREADESDFTTTLTLNNIGYCLQGMERHQEAQKYFKESIRLRRELTIRRDLNLILPLSNLSAAHLRAKEYGRALIYAEEMTILTLEIYGFITDSNELISMSSISSMDNLINDSADDSIVDLGVGLLTKHELTRSANDLLKALSAIEHSADESKWPGYACRSAILSVPDHKTVERLYRFVNLLYGYITFGKSDTFAIPSEHWIFIYAEKALALAREVMGHQSIETMNILFSCGCIYQFSQIYERAEPYMREALAICEQILETNNEYRLMLIEMYAECLFELGKYEQALLLQRDIGDASHSDISKTLYALGMQRIREESFLEAEKSLGDALDIRLKTFGLEHEDTIDSLHSMGTLYKQKGQHDIAHAYLELTVFLADSLSAEIIDKKGKYWNDLISIFPFVDLPHTGVEVKQQTFGIFNQDLVDVYNAIGSLLMTNDRNRDAYGYLKYAYKSLSTDGRKERGELVSQLSHNIGVVAANFGEYSVALSFFMEALSIREQLIGLQDMTTALYMRNVGIILQNLEKYSEAKSYLELATCLFSRISGMESDDTSKSVRGLLFTLKQIERFEVQSEVFESRGLDAEDCIESIGWAIAKHREIQIGLSYMQRLLQICRARYGETHEKTAKALNTIGYLSLNLELYDDAHFYFNQSLNIQMQLFGEQHVDTALSLHNLGITLANQGNPAGAVPYFERVLRTNQTIHGKDHATTLNALENLIAMYKQVDSQEAILAVRKDILGENHPDTATSYQIFASRAMAIEKDYEKAKSLYEKALEIQLETLGSKHESFASTLSSLGLCQMLMGEITDGLHNLGEAIVLDYRLRNANNPECISRVNNLANMLSMIDQSEWLTHIRRSMGKENADNATQLHLIGVMLSKYDHLQEAFVYLNEALNVRRAVLGEKHAEIAFSLTSVGWLLATLPSGDFEKGISYLQQALKIEQNIYGDQHPELLQTLSNLGVILNNAGQYEKAKPYLKQALDIRLATSGSNHIDTGRIQYSYALNLKHLDQHEDAYTFMNKALITFTNVLGSEHPNIIAVKQKLDTIKAELDAKNS